MMDPFVYAPKDLVVKASDFIKTLPTTALPKREELILKTVMDGNVPDFMRKFVPITHTERCSDGQDHTIEIFVAPDYLCVGTNNDFVRTPLFPTTAQKVADGCGSILPTRKIVNLIYLNAVKKIPAMSMPLGSMVTTDAFVQHDKRINALWVPTGVLTAGHKKDVVVSRSLYSDPVKKSSFRKKVGIFGWFDKNGKRIQGLNTTSHSSSYVDYSHGIRLVHLDCKVDGELKDLVDVLRHPVFSTLVSDEGVVPHPYYPY